MKGEKPMKKLISCFLILVLALTAVSASAGSLSPKPIAFEDCWEEAESKDPGVELIKPIPAENKEAVNKLVETGDLNANLFGNSIYIDEDVNVIPNPFQDQKLQTNALIPVSGFKVDKDKVEGKFVRIVTPIPDEVQAVLSADGVKAIFTFITTAEDGSAQYVSYVLDYFGFNQLAAGEQAEFKCKYQIEYSFSIPVLDAAKGCPAFLSFVKVQEQV